MRPWLTNIEFLPAVGRRELADDEVHIWRFSLVPPRERELLILSESILSQSILSKGERDRAARFHFEVHRTRFVAAHVAVRRILAGYITNYTNVETAPERVEFNSGAHGKPELANFTNIQFNLSHSGAAGVLAVSTSGPVGMDIEEVKPIDNISELVNRNFSKNERAAFVHIPESLQLETFYRVWTGKESWIKLLGAGLSIALDSFDVELDPTKPARIISIQDSQDSGHLTKTYSLLHLAPYPNTIATLATEGTPAISGFTFIG